MCTLFTMRSRSLGTLVPGLIALLSWMMCALPAASADLIGPIAAEPRPQTSKDALPLGRPRDRGTDAAPAAAPTTPLTDPGNLTTLGSLVLVIALIGVTAWVIKRASRNGSLMSSLGAGGRAPAGILEVLGRYPISANCTLVMLKMDRRILLISQSTRGRSGLLGGRFGGETTMETLSEITDPEDVASILMKVQDDESRAANERFQGLLGQVERDQARIERRAERSGGLVDSVDLRQTPLATRPAPTRSASPISQPKFRQVNA
jgi:flagellar biogenesis protein FliO